MSNKELIKRMREMVTYVMPEGTSKDVIENYTKTFVFIAVESVNQSTVPITDETKFPTREELKLIFTSDHYDSRNGNHKRINYQHVTGAEKLIEHLKRLQSKAITDNKGEECEDCELLKQDLERWKAINESRN